MSGFCQVTGRGPMSGNRVSHANNKNKRVFRPNLHKKRYWLAGENRYITLRVSAGGIRTIDKKGIDAVVAGLRAAGAKV